MIRPSEVRDLIHQRLPENYAVTYDFPYYVIPEHAPEKQHRLKQSENPTEFKTGLETAFLQVFATQEERTYEELLALFGEDLPALLEKYLQAGDIYESKHGIYRRL